jgi:hypothetical protein
MTPLRAITVCVNYADILATTLPYNIHQFKEITIVTDSKSRDGVQKVCWEMEDKSRTPITIFETDLFYRNGAKFNKWAALEAGLDVMGREGWICLLDADVLWPKDAWRQLDKIQAGFLYTPRRRMYPILPKSLSDVPQETAWRQYPLHNNDAEFAGYSQIFHASDRVLGAPPWHETNWKTAGSADSFFQLKWSPQFKIRPNFEALHLGPAGVNWAGRVTPYADGTLPENAVENTIYLHNMLMQRRGKNGMRRFDHERIKKDGHSS